MAASGRALRPRALEGGEGLEGGGAEALAGALVPAEGALGGDEGDDVRGGLEGAGGGEGGGARAIGAAGAGHRRFEAADPEGLVAEPGPEGQDHRATLEDGGAELGGGEVAVDRGDAEDGGGDGVLLEDHLDGAGAAEAVGLEGAGVEGAEEGAGGRVELGEGGVAADAGGVVGVEEHAAEGALHLVGIEGGGHARGGSGVWRWVCGPGEARAGMRAGRDAGAQAGWGRARRWGGRRRSTSAKRGRTAPRGFRSHSTMTARRLGARSRAASTMVQVSERTWTP